MENDALDLGTQFWLDIGNQTDITVAQLITALNATTTLTRLVVSCYDSSVNVDSRRVVEPLCRCLADLRLQNEHHPLKAIHFHYLDSDSVGQFLVALKQFGITRVLLRLPINRMSFPIHFFMDLCRDNSKLKVLNLKNVTFTGQVAADPIGGSATTTLNLDKLILNEINFDTKFAANNFAHLLSHMSVLALELGALLDEYDLFKMPSVEVLTVYAGSETKHFQAVLEAGMSTVTRLTVDFMPLDDENETTKKLKSLTHMIRGAVKLRSLTIHNHSSRNQLCPPRQLFQALEACASITEIHVNHDDGYPHDFTEPEVQQLRQITARNSELGQFVGNPSTFPNDKLLILMLQLDECPSGLYMLARRLPEVFSFEKGNCLFPSMEPNLTRKLRKRRKISYKA